MASSTTASQLRSSPRQIRRSYDDLTHDERRLCEPIWKRLEQVNRMKVAGSRRKRRKAFWGMVFKGWDTESSTWKPYGTPRASKKPSVSTLRVGTLTQDCPAPVGACKKFKGDRPGDVCPERRENAPVFVKLAVNAEAGSLDFKFVDQKRRLVPDELVQYDRGMSLAQVKSAVVERWDHAEAVRVGGWNREMATYRAQGLLVRSLELNYPNNRDPDSDPGRHRERDAGPDDRQLVRLVFASDFIHTSAQVDKHFRKVHASVRAPYLTF